MHVAHESFEWNPDWLKAVSTYTGYLAPHIEQIKNWYKEGLKYQEMAERLYDEGVRGFSGDTKEDHCRAIKGSIGMLMSRRLIANPPRRGRVLSEKIRNAVSAYRRGLIDKARLITHINDLLLLHD